MSTLSSDLVDLSPEAAALARGDGEWRNAEAAQKNLDVVIAQDLNRMSLQDRERVYEEVHGVDEEVQETPELIAKSLQRLDERLNHMPHKEAYDLAERMNYSYVHSRKFRLMFLRAEYFDCDKAAIRLVKFLKGKLDFFGPETLCRDLYVDDLDPEDQETLKSGVMQFLPTRDRGGRAVFCDLHTMYPRTYKVSRNLVRNIFVLLCLTAMLF